MNNMPDPEPLVITRMQNIISSWESQTDGRSIFLNCYKLMTSNMLVAVEQKEFSDSEWVNQLLHAFADYYFLALENYDRNPDSTPSVWRLAHDASTNPDITPLQKLLLGVNAHINYDLVLTLVDLLQPEWIQLKEERRKIRYADHCLVNEVIGRTIDSVQDELLEPAMPVLDIIDKLLGPLDEYLISRLITNWRENVWQNATRLIETNDPEEQQRLLSLVEEDTLRIGNFILGPGSFRPGFSFSSA
jgi:hypothetical protein